MKTAKPMERSTLGRQLDRQQSPLTGVVRNGMGSEGEFNAFKIVKSFQIAPPLRKGGQPHWQIHTYYYAPSVKAIVQYRAEDDDIKETATLVDFNLTE
jgi:hypothetical protein